MEPEKQSMSPGVGSVSPPCLGSAPDVSGSGSGSGSAATNAENKGVAGDSSDSGTSMSLVSNGDNSGGSIPPVGPASSAQPLVESVSGEIAELLGHLDQPSNGEAENSTLVASASHGRLNGVQQMESVNSGGDQTVSGGVGASNSLEGAVGGSVVSSIASAATVPPEAEGLARGDTPDPPCLPPRTYREQPAPPLPPRNHRRDKDAPPLPPRNNTDKVHKKRQAVEATVVPPERTHSLDLAPPPLPPRTYSPIHMSGGSHSPGSGLPGPQVPEGERSGGSSAEGFSTSVTCNHAHHHHHHHQNVDSPSTSNDSGNASREDDPSGSWRPQLMGQQPQSRHSVAEVERTRGRDPLLAQNLGLTNHARERNSLPVLADNSPNLHVIDAAGGGGITPPARPHPKLLRTGAVESRPAPLVTSVSEQTPPPPHNQTAELRRLKGRSVDAVAHPEPGSTASIPPRLQPRARMQSEEERQQQWQQINQQLQIWTRRQIERADSPRHDAAHCHIHEGEEECRVPCTECEAGGLADVSSISASVSPSAAPPQPQPASVPSPHSPQAAVSPGDGMDGREARGRTGVASSGGHGHGHSREDSTPPPPVPASSRQSAGTSSQAQGRSSSSGK